MQQKTAVQPKPQQIGCQQNYPNNINQQGCTNQPNAPLVQNLSPKVGGFQKGNTGNINNQANNPKYPKQDFTENQGIVNQGGMNAV